MSKNYLVFGPKKTTISETVRGAKQVLQDI
jgi:hypothetical protein